MLLWAFSSHAADKETLFNELKKHEALSASTWSGLIGKEIKDRILPAPDIIIDYLIKDNQLQGYKEIPHKAEIDDEFFSDIVQAIAELPQSVRDHIHEHLVAVFLVEELGGTGYCELLRDFNKNRLGFIVLDVGSLDRKANEWVSWRENSPFAMKGLYTIEAEIEQKRNDTRMGAIQYILLHEIGHLIGVAKGAHPHWVTGGNPQKWPFTKLSWLTLAVGLKGKSKFDGTFSKRSEIKYYSFENALLTSKEINEIYGHFLKTDFVSLFAATNMYDDFAETYAMYVHVILQNRPWKIRIMKEGKKESEITTPIFDKRCEAKKSYLDKMFR
ncbi:MAG: hypothetical protein KKD47_06165 [Proteobacteria bacterium]|nr:hypothetical protein [Pseudomonadota bacterium]